jgi:hypothetical protein
MLAAEVEALRSQVASLTAERDAAGARVMHAAPVLRALRDVAASWERHRKRLTRREADLVRRLGAHDRILKATTAAEKDP